MVNGLLNPFVLPREKHGSVLSDLVLVFSPLRSMRRLDLMKMVLQKLHLDQSPVLLVLDRFEKVAMRIVYALVPLPLSNPSSSSVPWPLDRRHHYHHQLLHCRQYWTSSSPAQLLSFRLLNHLSLSSKRWPYAVDLAQLDQTDLYSILLSAVALPSALS